MQASQIQPENLPMPDDGIMALIQYALEEDADIDTLARMVALNPSLTVQLLGIVNSAFFGLRRPVTTISEALVTLGLKQVQSLVLCFAVKETFSDHTIPEFDINGFWTDSVRRGVAARELARRVQGPAEEAFSAGMLLDIGLLALFFMEPDKADRWPLLRPNLPGDRRRMEKSLFQTTHDQMGGFLAEKWGLPPSYVTAINSHHMKFTKPGKKPADNTPAQWLTALIHTADLCNAVYTCHDKAGALKLLEGSARHLFGLAADEMAGLLSRLPDLVKAVTASMEIRSGPMGDFTTIMDQAGQKLAEDNITYRELTWKLQHSLEQRDEYARRLQAELGVAREIQESLQPDPELFPGIAAFNLPAYHLSGDFYDFFALPSGKIGFCIGDVSGKGTAAALLMAKAISLFRCLCKLETHVEKVVKMMNTEIYETAVRGMFITFAGGWIDPLTHKVTLINMGHLPPIIIQDNKVTRLHPGAPPLGVLPNASPKLSRLSIAKGRLFLYTDGFTEGRLKSPPQKKGDLLGEKGFLGWLVRSGQLPIQDQAQWIKEKSQETLAPRSDDLTLMIVGQL